MDEIYALERTLEKMIYNHFQVVTVVDVTISDLDSYRLLSAEIMFELPVPKHFADQVNKYVASYIERNPSLN